MKRFKIVLPSGEEKIAVIAPELAPEKALDEILDRHLGPAPASGHSAMWLLIPLMPQGWNDATPIASATVGAIHRRSQQKAWREVKRLARELSQAARKLEVPVLRRIVNESVDEDEGDEWGPDYWERFWVSVLAFETMIERVGPGIEKFMDITPDAGRRSMPAVAVIEGLRDIWKERTGEEAPDNIHDSGGPFADLVVDVFELLEIGKPRAAMDSWRKYRDKHPKK
jgi:hypothetical protein